MKVWLLYPWQNCYILGPFITRKEFVKFDNKKGDTDYSRTHQARRWLERDKTWSAPHEPGDFVVEGVTRLKGADEEWHLGS